MLVLKLKKVKVFVIVLSVTVLEITQDSMTQLFPYERTSKKGTFFFC